MPDNVVLLFNFLNILFFNHSLVIALGVKDAAIALGRVVNHRLRLLRAATDDTGPGPGRENENV